MCNTGERDVVAVIARYDCPRCVGTGSLESSDSTEDGWWDCSACEGTGKLADRRRPDPQLRGAVEALRKLAAIHHDTIAPSKLHDPHNRDWTECECKSCRLAQPFGGQ